MPNAACDSAPAKKARHGGSSPGLPSSTGACIQCCKGGCFAGTCVRERVCVRARAFPPRHWCRGSHKTFWHTCVYVGVGTAFHVTCAQLAGYHMVMLSGGDEQDEVPPLTPFCPKHRPRFIWKSHYVDSLKFLTVHPHALAHVWSAGFGTSCGMWRARVLPSLMPASRCVCVTVSRVPPRTLPCATVTSGRWQMITDS